MVGSSQQAYNPKLHQVSSLKLQEVSEITSKNLINWDYMHPKFES